MDIATVVATFAMLQRRTAAVSLLRRTAARTQRKRQADEQILLAVVRRIHFWAKRTKTTVPQLFAKIDTDSSGSIDFLEFRLGMADLGLKFTNEETNVLLKHMDKDGDEILDTDEFCQKMSEMLEDEASSGSAILSSFLLYLSNSGMTAAEFFAERDLDSSGTLDSTEFQALLQEVGIKVSATAAATAMAELDTDGDASLEIDEMAANLHEYARKRRVFATTVLGKVCDYLEATNSSVVRLFARVDADGSGDLDVLELQEALRRMKVDLSELEVEEMMRELMNENGRAATDMTCGQFLDKLKQFKKDHKAFSDRCRQLFEEADEDSSGHLEPSEVFELANKMGLAEQLADPSSKLTLETMMQEIKASRKPEEDLGDNKTSGQGAENTENEGYVTLEELLPWLLNVGRSYLPPPAYGSVQELDDLSEEELKVLFSSMDSDGSGEIERLEAINGTVLTYPYVDVALVEKAFDAADASGDGKLELEEFDELIRCLHFLNQYRHEIDELTTSFGSTGVGEFEFYVCLALLGIQTSDSEAIDMFDVECVRLGVVDGVLTVHQFLMWVCRKECIDKSTVVTQEAEQVAHAASELDACMNDFGDIFFEDLAKVVFTQAMRKKNSERRDQTQSKVASGFGNWRKASKEAVARLESLREGIAKAFIRHETFPVLTTETIMELVRAVETDIYYSGQNLITQDTYEDIFYIIRRGTAEILVDGEVQETVTTGDPIGELALMYGTKHAVTVRTAGPCEVFRLDRSSYETAIASLPENERQSPLMKIMQKFWLLVTGPDGSKRPDVDYAVYLEYHKRVSKTLMLHHEATDFDEEQQRDIALEDWKGDCKRFDLKVTGVLTESMFFDSIYQMVELWAGDLQLSYVAFLELLFDNIAVWIDEPAPGHWAFQQLENVSGAGEQLEDMQAKAKQAMEAEAAQKREQAAQAEQFRIAAEEKARERREKIRAEHERRLTQQKKEEEAQQVLLEAQAQLEGSGLTSQNCELDISLEGSEGASELTEQNSGLVNAILASDEAPNISSDGSEGANELTEENSGLVNAILAGDEARMKQLLAEGADPSTSSEGWPVLAIASQQGNAGIVRALLDSGADVDQALPSGATSLIVAADAGQSNCVAILLSFGANANAARSDGATSLHMAAAKDYSTILGLLLGDEESVAGERRKHWSKADPEKVDGNGATALAIASHNGCTACTHLLRHAVAKKWKQSKYAERNMVRPFDRNEDSGVPIRLPMIWGAKHGAMTARPDAVHGPQTAVPAPRHKPRNRLLTMPFIPRKPRESGRSNVPTRNIWLHGTSSSKHAGSATSGLRDPQNDLNNALGSELADALVNILNGIRDDVHRSSRSNKRSHTVEYLPVGHLRLLHHALRGGSIVMEAVHRGHETVAVRVIALKASHSGLTDPCIICLCFRGPSDAMLFGSPRCGWDPVALGNAVDAACAACREHAMMRIIGKQAVRPSLSLDSRLIAYLGEVQFSGARTKTVSWQDERGFADAISWLQTG